MKPQPKLTKHTFHLEAGQFARLARLHPNIKCAEIIRSLISAYLAKNEAKLEVAETATTQDLSL